MCPSGSPVEWRILVYCSRSRRRVAEDISSFAAAAVVVVVVGPLLSFSGSAGEKSSVLNRLFAGSADQHAPSQSFSSSSQLYRISDG